MKLFEQFIEMEPSVIFNSFFRMFSRKIMTDERLREINQKIERIAKCTFQFVNPREVYDDSEIRIGKMYDVVVMKDNEYFWSDETESTIKDILLLLPDQDGYFYFLGRKMYSPFVVFDKFCVLTEDDENHESDESKSNDSKRFLDLNNSIVLQGYYLGVASALLQVLYDKVIHGNSRLTNVPINSLARKLGVTYNVFFASKKSKEGRKTYVAQKIPLFFLPDEINEIERLSCPRKVVYPNEKVSDTVRYPHESHFGIVDLLETPESEKIGLTLTLVDSDDLCYDFENLKIVRQLTSGVENKENILSLATKQIPFILHSDGARMLMGSKNLKQAVKVEQAEKPILSTGFEKENLGVNALVAYGLFYGFNFEDGIVVSQSFAERMSCKVIEEEKYSIDVPSTKDARIEQNTWIYRGDKNKTTKITWMVCKGEDVSYGKVLYEVRDEHGIFKQQYKGKYKAKIIDLPKEPPLAFQTHLKEKIQIEFRIKYEVNKPLELGDKLMGRHGNKGTVSLIVVDDQMPMVEINGEKKPVEVILSPLGVVSRMNLGQLYETHITMAQVHAGFNILKQVSPLENAYSYKDYLLERLKSIGADDYGRFKVIYKDNEWRLTVGYQYLYRLDHCVRDKIHVVSIAQESKLTNQPMKGRVRYGGQRFGELEFWSLYSYSNRGIIKLFASKNLSEEIVSQEKYRYLRKYPEDLLKEIFQRLFSFQLDTDDYMISRFHFATSGNHGKDDIDEYISTAFRKIPKSDKQIQALLKLWFLSSQDKYEESYKQFVSELSVIYDKMQESRDVKNSDDTTSTWESKITEILEKYQAVRELFKNVDIDVDQLIKKVREGKLKESYFKSFVKNLIEMHGKKSKLLEALSEFLMQKEGYLRDQVIARRLHYSGRTVISPMPLLRLEEYEIDLDIDTCVLPVDFGIEWLEQRLEQEYNITDNKILSALQGDYKFRKEIAKVLNKIVEKDDIYVLLNRQPSIHRHSVQGFKPVFWHNYTIGLPINVCEGFNADFDGDTMAVYYPTIWNEEIRKEIRKMMPSRNPFKLGNGELIYSLDQDMVYGYYLKNGCISNYNKKKLKEEASAKIRQYLLQEDYESIKTFLRTEILGTLIQKATQENLTLSIYEIDKEEGSMKVIKESKCRGNDEQYKQLNDIITVPHERGTHQITGGFVKGVSIQDYFDVEKGIVKRARSTLMDKKLKVAEAGYFTRKLVEFLGNIRVKTDVNDYLEHEIDLTSDHMKQFGKSRFLYRWIKDDTGVRFIQQPNDIPDKFKILSPRIIETGNGDLLVSAKYCGKDISTLKNFTDGEYIGISAGHVIGERGTQLSMQTFHTGGKGLQMNSVSNSVFKSAFESKSYQEFIERVENEFQNSMKQSLLKSLDSNSIYFELIYNFAQHLKHKGIDSANKYFDNHELRGPLTCMTFEKGLKVLERLDLDHAYKEIHPRVEYSFYWRCM